MFPSSLCQARVGAHFSNGRVTTTVVRWFPRPLVGFTKPKLKKQFRSGAGAVKRKKGFCYQR